MAEDQQKISKTTEEVDVVTIRFAGDSGDGMQLTGSQFTNNTAIVGNDLSTFPDYPSEIRAPAGSLAGVSSFQIQFGSQNIYTPGDTLDVLVAMNPAALKVHLKDLKINGLLLLNSVNYTPRNYKLAGWESNPLEDKTLKDYRVAEVNMSELVANSVKDLNLSPKVINRSANMFALGFLYYMYDRNLDSTIDFITAKFGKYPDLAEANRRSLKAGYNYAHTIKIIRTNYRIPKAKFKKGTYRNIMGNQAVSFGLVAAARKAGLELFYGGYPITPASDILHYLSGFKNFGVKTFQAEDEIAGVMSTIGAAYAGDLAITATSGPGMALKTEALGLAVSVELPMVIINVQRGGPSTGLPTKTEQSDLFQAVLGRNGEAPIPVVAAQTPAHCFDAAYEACRIALEHMIPVILLSDGYLGNGSEPWRIPEYKKLPEIKTHKKTDPEDFLPYRHDEKTLARPWVVPGTANMEYRVGGLEKSEGTGNVNYTPENHQLMTELRQRKLDIIADSFPPVVPFGNSSGELLILGWGSTFGAIRTAVENALAKGLSVGHVQLTHLNPFPKDLGEVLGKFKQILIPELNMGQLQTLIQGKFVVKTEGLHKMKGVPFTQSDIYNKMVEMLKGLA
ncbi:MAG: 2-oxoacid:acceptor oxidoreductase subunit alpha [FCB group bacterium]|nr:2-oxoacid:acceptor oxidoreductase subunit alpha [FCB group bacterium]